MHQDTQGNRMFWCGKKEYCTVLLCYLSCNSCLNDMTDDRKKVETWAEYGARCPLRELSHARRSSVDWSRVTTGPCTPLIALDTSRATLAPRTPLRPAAVHCTPHTHTESLDNSDVLETIHWSRFSLSPKKEKKTERNIRRGREKRDHFVSKNDATLKRCSSKL